MTGTRFAVRSCCAAVLTLGIAVSAAPAASARDFSSTALNIIPSGQYGSVPPPPGADRQAKLYDGLTPLFDHVGTRDLFRYFKSEKLGYRGRALRVERPRAGLRIVRDSFDVPHITGATDNDVTFGAGWVSAEDRGLLLEQARYNSRVAAVDAPGLSAIDLVKGLKSFKPSAQTEREVAKQTRVILAQGARGRQLLHDIDVFTSGINAYYRSHGVKAKPWTRNDIYALNALKGQFLGQGGGDESRGAELLDALRKRFGAARGHSIFDDLHQRSDPETPVSVDGHVSIGATPPSDAGNVVIDNGSLDTSAANAAAAAARHRQLASNILMVTGRRSATHHPLFVGGPQIGYFYPGLTLEMDLKGPHIDVRGATSAPFPGYMLIGRGEDFAFTLTSATGDIIDQYVETLCGGSRVKYLYKGRCRAMTRFDAGSLSGKEVVFDRTVHGPVIGYARVHGRPVAISSKRSTYGRDTLDQLAFQDLTYGRVHDVASFYRAMNRSPQTFNAFYADSKHIAMFTTGRLPIRARDVDPALPTNGNGRHEWRGFLSQNQHAHGSDPRNGEIVNWNNTPQRGFHPADDEYRHGAVDRVQLLLAGMARHRIHTLATITSAMNGAATQDAREMLVFPTIDRVLRTGKAPSARAAQMAALLRAWRARGGSRLDRNLDGSIDDPGAAIMDAVFPRWADAVMQPRLGVSIADQLDSIFSKNDQAPGGQSGGWGSYIVKDLRTLLGDRVRGRFSVRFCGDGNLAACRASLWGALEAAGAQLAAAQGPDPAAWREDATKERITFAPGLLSTTMRYTNRPSGIQQVISFFGHRPAASTRKRARRPRFTG